MGGEPHGGVHHPDPVGEVADPAGERKITTFDPCTPAKLGLASHVPQCVNKSLRYHFALSWELRVGNKRSWWRQVVRRTSSPALLSPRVAPFIAVCIYRDDTEKSRSDILVDFTQGTSRGKYVVVYITRT